MCIKAKSTFWFSLLVIHSHPTAWEALASKQICCIIFMLGPLCPHHEFDPLVVIVLVFLRRKKRKKWKVWTTEWNILSSRTISNPVHLLCLPMVRSPIDIFTCFFFFSLIPYQYYGKEKIQSAPLSCFIFYVWKRELLLFYVSGVFQKFF